MLQSKNKTKPLLFLLCISTTSNANEHFQSFAQTGFTGLLRTPNAYALDFGDLNITTAWEDNVDKEVSATIGAHNSLVVGIGVLPGLEFVVQNSFKRYQWDGFKVGPGSDLSFAAKYELNHWLREFGHLRPKFDNWLSDYDFDFSRVNLALGVQDFGGANAYHKNLYVVASYRNDDFEFSTGFGKGYSTNKMGGNYLNGLFGGVSWQATPWIQLQADFDGTGINAGVKLSAPHQWLPENWKMNAVAQLYSGSDMTDRDNAWYGLQLAVPLVSGSSPKRYTPLGVNRSTLSPIVTSDKHQINTTNSVSKKLKKNLRKDKRLPEKNYTNTFRQAQNDTWRLNSSHKALQYQQKNPSDAQLDLISNRLISKGFETVSVGRSNNRVVVAFENNIFRQNELDGLGVVLGVVAEILTSPSTQKSQFDVYLLKRNIPVIKVGGNASRYMKFLTNDGKGHTISGGSSLYANNYNLDVSFSKVKWLSSNRQQSSFVPRIGLFPSLYSVLGTEYGVFDYSLALAGNFQLPLWQGAELDVRGSTPITSTSDFGDGHSTRFQAHSSSIDRVLMHQAFSFSQGMVTQFSVGQVYEYYRGAMNETRWQSPSGRHKIKFEVGHFNHKDISRLKAEPAIVYYRYHMPEHDWSIEFSAGKYWHGDNGFSIMSKHWFGDTTVNLSIQKSDFTFAGLSFSIPLTPRKEMRPRGFQVTGIEQWTWGYRTMISNSENFLHYGNLVASPDLQHNIDRAYFNRDRLSPAYIRANLNRLKNAYRVFADDG